MFITERFYPLKTSDKIGLLKLLTQSYQPLLYIGGGVIRSNAFKIIHQLASRNKKNNAQMDILKNEINKKIR